MNICTVRCIRNREVGMASLLSTLYTHTHTSCIPSFRLQVVFFVVVQLWGCICYCVWDHMYVTSVTAKWIFVLLILCLILPIQCCSYSTWFCQFVCCQYSIWFYQFGCCWYSGWSQQCLALKLCEQVWKLINSIIFPVCKIKYITHIIFWHCGKKRHGFITLEWQNSVPLRLTYLRLWKICAVSCLTNR
jgi:hypothetical protein